MESLTLLQIKNALPHGFLDLNAKDIKSLIPGPTLFSLPGERTNPLFVSILLHGNEVTGLLAAQKLLKKYKSESKNLPRSLLLFIGNIEASSKGLRRLPNQPDYNRIWDGGTKPEQKMATELLSHLSQHDLFASIDIHNTSGRNPHYSCLAELHEPSLCLARLFCQNIVYFSQPREVLAKALLNHSPAITIEAGQPGEAHGVQKTFEFLETVLHLNELPQNFSHEHGLNIYHSVARIKVPEKSGIGFGTSENVDFLFPEDFDLLNFSDLHEGALLGHRFNDKVQLIVLDEANNDVSNDYIAYSGKEIRLKKSVTPSMFSLNEPIIRQDCLGYLMKS